MIDEESSATYRVFWGIAFKKYLITRRIGSDTFYLNKDNEFRKLKRDLTIKTPFNVVEESKEKVRTFDTKEEAQLKLRTILRQIKVNKL
jgi:hypothetical protein